MKGGVEFGGSGQGARIVSAAFALWMNRSANSISEPHAIFERSSKISGKKVEPATILVTHDLEEPGDLAKALWVMRSGSLMISATSFTPGQKVHGFIRLRALQTW